MIGPRQSARCVWYDETHETDQARKADGGGRHEGSGPQGEGDGDSQAHADVVGGFASERKGVEFGCQGP